PYYGLRLMRWMPSDWGLGVEVNHAKVYADDATLAASGFSRLEMTDGINYVTLNAMRRFPDAWGGMTPYVGAGLGLAVPHVDVETPGGQRTFEYQVTGPAVVLIAGVKRPLSDRLSAFVEYKGAYSRNDIALDGGGSLETDLITNALNIGLSWSF
ncbi:MAG: outer membrane protein, partial [Shimia sp.]